MLYKLTQLYTISLAVILVISAFVVGVTHNPLNSVYPHVAHATTAIETNDTSSVLNRQEILWLARIVYSETKRPQEQVLVAWIVRNRVESPRFGNTYKQVALSSGQFSGLNAFDKQYRHNISRTYQSGGGAWKSAVDIARAVYYADSALRPFSPDVRHFYSPRSLKHTPSWAQDKKPIYVIRDPKSSSVRFAFYEGVK